VLYFPARDVEQGVDFFSGELFWCGHTVFFSCAKFELLEIGI
jgi:hypothetical protein